jgi:hypothetical protein
VILIEKSTNKVAAVFKLFGIVATVRQTCPTNFLLQQASRHQQLLQTKVFVVMVVVKGWRWGRWW